MLWDVYIYMGCIWANHPPNGILNKMLYNAHLGCKESLPCCWNSGEPTVNRQKIQEVVTRGHAYGTHDCWPLGHLLMQIHHVSGHPYQGNLAHHCGKAPKSGGRMDGFHVWLCSQVWEVHTGRQVATQVENGQCTSIEIQYVEVSLKANYNLLAGWCSRLRVQMVQKVQNATCM